MEPGLVRKGHMLEFYLEMNSTGKCCEQSLHQLLFSKVLFPGRLAPQHLVRHLALEAARQANCAAVRPFIVSKPGRQAAR